MASAAPAPHPTRDIFARRAWGDALFSWPFEALAAILSAPLTLAVFVVQRP